MALTDTEVSQCKFWLGYGNLTASARPYFDIAVIFERLVAQNVDTWGEGYVRTTILPNLLQLDTDIFASRDRYKASAICDVKMNAREMDDLVRQKDYWIDQLVSVIKVQRVPLPGKGACLEVY